MPYLTLNPATGRIEKAFDSWDAKKLNEALIAAQRAQIGWRETDFSKRAKLMLRAAALLRERAAEYAAIMTLEMGKVATEARAEIEKCAIGCDFYAGHAERFLADELVETDAGRSYVCYQPLGTVLAIMPWNFPFWQVFRFAAPALMAGNAGILKHAPNVPQCALAIETIFRDAGFPEHLFTAALVETDAVPDAIAGPYVNAVTLTGSEGAGREVAGHAGRHLKKCVLELGGSDPFIVLADADLEFAAGQAIKSRYMNCGQSCIAAKRFILAPGIADDFIDLLKTRAAALKIGDPSQESTQLGPMARRDLRDNLHSQIQDSIKEGALAALGCSPVEGVGFYYLPSILDRVTPKTRAWREEFFGPVALIIRAQDEADAIRIANDTRFGLGASVWSTDAKRAEKLGREIASGSTFVNGLVKSDPRLPFGGVKASGFGRELSYHGIREFTNIKTVWIK